MNDRDAFFGGLLAGALLMMSAHAVYWFIAGGTRRSAGRMRTAAVVLQLLVGLGGAAWLMLRVM